MKAMLAVTAMVLIAGTAFSAKKQVSPEMLAIRKVYITGHHEGQIEWALKNFPQNKGSCLKPVSTPEEADAILQIEPTYPEGERPAKHEAPTWVDCSTSRNSTHCVDSNGYATDTSCSTDRGGNVNCTTTYGPDMGVALLHLLGAAARRTSVDVYLYDKTGKRLLWKDEQGTTFLHVWADELNGVVGCVKQKCPVTHFRPCDRRWYDPSQLGPDGKLKKTNDAAPAVGAE